MPSTDPASRPPSREQRSLEAARLFERAAAATDDLERAQIHEDIVALYLGVASSIARRFRNRGAPEDDLRQIASLALVVAVKRFDPSRGEDFLTFAVPTIAGELKRYFRDHGWMIRPTRRIQELQALIGPTQEELTQRLARSPRPVEISLHLDVPLESVIEALVAHDCYTPTSLDCTTSALGGRGTESPGADLPSLDRPEDVVEARVMLAPALRRLTERDRTILAMRFFEQRTQQEIGDHLGVSQIQVSRLLKRILRNLHGMLTAEPERHRRKARHAAASPADLSRPQRRSHSLAGPFPSPGRGAPVPRTRA